MVLAGTRPLLHSAARWDQSPGFFVWKINGKLESIMVARMRNRAAGNQLGMKQSALGLCVAHLILVAHLAAVAATRVRIPDGILPKSVHKVKTRDEE